MLATDPETGESGAREVQATLPHTDQLLTLQLSSGEVVTTEDHKYWNATDQAWQESQDLDEGDQLLTADGDDVTVEGLDWSTMHTAPAFDLTVDDLHTFYVGAGDDEVLVHNCPASAWGRTIDDFKSNPSAWKRVSAQAEGSTSSARAYQGGTSIEEVFQGPGGEILVRHRVVDVNGNVIHETFRPDAKFGR